MTAALLLALPAFAQSEPQSEPILRLVLKDGKTIDLVDPIKHLDGLVLFRVPGKGLSSIQENQIEKIIELKPGAKTPAREASDPAVQSFSNEDLPETTSAETNPVIKPIPGAFTNEDLLSNSEVEESEEPASENDVVETDGVRDAAWWRGQQEALEAEITLAERKEQTTWQFLVCAEHGIPLDDGQCAMKVGRLRKMNQRPNTPTEKSLTRQLGEVRSELKEAREKLVRLQEEALAAGHRL